jgi:hypothetical protein
MKDKKRTREDAGNLSSPKNRKGKDSSVGEKSPKRARRENEPPSNGTATELSIDDIGDPPRQTKFNSHVVSGSNGMSGVLENVTQDGTTSTAAPDTETLSKSAQKKLKRKGNDKSSDSPAKTNQPEEAKHSGNGASKSPRKSPKKSLLEKTTIVTDNLALFSGSERLVPGPKRTAMAADYESSKP